MSDGSARRKILIVEDEPSIRKLLHGLLSNLDCEGDVADSGKQALAMLHREEFDAVLLDIRSCDLSPGEVVSGIHYVRPSLVGHVLVITGEVADAKTMELIEQNFLLQIPRNRILPDVAGSLRALFRISPVPNRPT